MSNYSFNQLSTGWCANKKNKNQIATTYVTGVDKPGDVSKGSQFPVHIAANFTVFPAVVDVNESHHVPLQQQKEEADSNNGKLLLYIWSINHTQQHINKSACGENHLAYSIGLLPSCPLKLRSHLLRFPVSSSASEIGYWCYHSKMGYYGFSRTWNKALKIEWEINWNEFWALVRFIEVRWCLHAQGKEEDVSNCPQATGSLWLQWSSVCVVPGRDWEYWIILLSCRPHSSSF